MVKSLVNHRKNSGFSSEQDEKTLVGSLQRITWSDLSFSRFTDCCVRINHREAKVESERQEAAIISKQEILVAFTRVLEGTGLWIF